MSKKVKTSTQDWKILVVKVLGFYYLLEFILIQSQFVIRPFPIQIYSFFMKERIISPFTATGDVVAPILDSIWLFLLKSIGPEVFVVIAGTVVMVVEIIFIIGLLKRWRFSWAVLVFTMFLGLLKNYAISDPWGLIRVYGSFNPSYGLINIYTIITIAYLYILYKIRSYYK
ncbi:MAG: hypothetical protein PHQ59_01685 [Candidatus Daviesbacteria bacterium]|nr:hypothetical protein [Candidatus Daviesbacteria bacterium]